MEEYQSNSEQETKSVAQKLARAAKGRIFALTGELGTGKTIFVQGFAKGLGIKDKIISPTFVLIRRHKIPGTKKVLYHIDLYRLDNTADLKNLGLQEIWSDPNNIVLIEWAERIKNLLPEDTLIISFEIINEGTRRITINNLL